MSNSMFGGVADGCRGNQALDVVGCAVGVAVGGAGVQVGNGSMGITVG